jgi:hypothetical protein
MRIHCGSGAFPALGQRETTVKDAFLTLAGQWVDGHLSKIRSN